MAETKERDTAKRRTRGGGIMLPGLRNARENKALTLKELEAASGVPFATISKLELGRRGALGRTAKALAAALDVSVKDLRRA